MAKFRQGDLVLTATQRIIQGSDTLVDANGAAYFATLEVSGAAQLYTLTFASGATINELSTDGTLAGDSDTAVPTEKAIKTYIDNQIALVNLPHNELQGLQGGDATSSEFYHLTQAIYDALYSSSPLIGLGSQSGTNFEVDYGSDLITASINSTKVLDLQENVQIFGSDNYYIMIDQTSNITII